MDYLIAKLPEPVMLAADSGSWDRARALIDSYLKKGLPAPVRARLEFEKERLRRIAIAHPHGKKAALRLLRGGLSGFKSKELREWVSSGLIVPRDIEGKPRFFSGFVSNLMFLDRQLANRRRIQDFATSERRREIDRRIDKLIAGATPVRYRIRARIDLTLMKKPKEKVRCWLPFPRVADQVSFARVCAASHSKYLLAPAKAPSRTIYFEGRDKRFFVEFEYEIAESVSVGAAGSPDPYAFPELSRFLAEQPPHIVFTPYVRELARTIVGAKKDNHEKARKIYDWVTLNVDYALTLPYSTYENLSEHTLVNLQGDCGAQAVAFITLCRAAGVPARWQSGWFISPKAAAPHDWAMFHDGRWHFADLSFGGSRRKREKRRLFYFGGLDGFRMPANSEYAGKLWPPKKHWRSDPSDNQIGEVETDSGNIYSDRFRHKITVLEFLKVT